MQPITDSQIQVVVKSINEISTRPNVKSIKMEWKEILYGDGIVAAIVPVVTIEFFDGKRETQTTL